MEHSVLVPPSLCSKNKSSNTQAVTKQELPKYQADRNPTYQIDSLKCEINKKLFATADFLVDRYLSCPCSKLSNLQTLDSDSVEWRILLSEVVLQLCRKNADVPVIYFTLFDAAGISPTLVLNQNSKTKERGSWVPIKIWMSEGAKAVRAKWSCLWFCTQLSGSYQLTSMKGEIIFAFRTFLFKIYSCHT